MEQVASEVEFRRIVQSCDVNSFPLSRAFYKQLTVCKKKEWWRRRTWNKIQLRNH